MKKAVETAKLKYKQPLKVKEGQSVDDALQKTLQEANYVNAFLKENVVQAVKDEGKKNFGKKIAYAPFLSIKLNLRSLKHFFVVI
jgi:hypothetical protein